MAPLLDSVLKMAFKSEQIDQTIAFDNAKKRNFIFLASAHFETRNGIYIARLLASYNQNYTTK